MAEHFRKEGIQLADPYDGLPNLNLAQGPFVSEREKAGVILRLLRQAAVERRSNTLQRFYSIRSVARHFDVPTTTVMRAYEVLKKEGILGTMWGSKTFIEPAHFNRGINLKGIVGLVAARKQYNSLQEYREFFSCVEEALWRNGFGARLVFYEDCRHAGTPSLVDRLIEFQVDAAVWYLPHPESKSAVARLADRAVQSIIISEPSPVNGHHGCFIDRTPALRAVFSNWRVTDVGPVAIFGSTNPALTGRLRSIETCLRESKLQFRIFLGDASARSNFSSQGAFVYVDSETFLEHRLHLSGQTKEASSQSHILLSGGAVDPLARYPLKRAVDVVRVDWSKESRRLVQNILGPTRFTPQTQQIFLATRETLTPDGDLGPTG